MTTDLSLRVASTVPLTRAEGPGLRFAVWVQGCSLQCSGCFNPHMWSARGGTAVTPEEIARQAVGSGAQGITLLGGEPFEQARALARLAALVRGCGLSVMVFSGFYLQELLQSRERGVAELLAQTDLLVDGPYVADHPDRERPWVGSTNQGFHFLTDRYQNLKDELSLAPDRIELRVSANGHVSVNGWAGVQQLDELLCDVTPPIGRGQVR